MEPLERIEAGSGLRRRLGGAGRRQDGQRETDRQDKNGDDVHCFHTISSFLALLDHTSPAMPELSSRVVTSAQETSPAYGWSARRRVYLVETS